MISLTLFSSQRDSSLVPLITQFTSGHGFLHKVLCSEQHAVFSLPSVSLQARYSVHPGFTLPRETGQVPWSQPVVAVVIGPGDRGSGGWEFLVSNRMRRVTSIFTMTQPLTAAVGFFKRNNNFRRGETNLLIVYCCISTLDFLFYLMIKVHVDHS